MRLILTVYEPQILFANKLTKCWKNTTHGFRKEEHEKDNKKEAKI